MQKQKTELLKNIFLICSMIFITSCISFSYPDARNQTKPKQYGFSQVYKVKRPTNYNAGINLGCNLRGLSKHKWGTRLEEYDFKAICEAGFYYVRFSVHFLRHLKRDGEAYYFQEDFLEYIDWIINTILKYKMVAILDFHYLLPDEKTSFDSVQERAQNEEQFYAVWKILARRYKDYPTDLYFDLANEPHKPITPEMWNRYVKNGLQIIRGVKGKDRTVLIGSSNWNSVHNLDELELPSVKEDPNIIVTFHYYNPIAFTFQGVTSPVMLNRGSKNWVGNKWNNTARQKIMIQNDFDIVSEWAKQHNRKIMLGEFGVSNQADIDSRVNWIGFIREEAEARNMPWLYWGLFDEYTNVFGNLYNRELLFWNKEILETLFPENKIVKSESDSMVRQNTRIHRVKKLMAELEDPKWKVRLRAAKALKILTPESEIAIPGLIKALSDEEWQVRYAVIRSLTPHGKLIQAATPDLIKALKDREWQVRKAAAQAFPGIGSAASSIIAALIEAANDEEWQVRKYVLLALCCLGLDNPEVQELLFAFQDDPEKQVQKVVNFYLRIVTTGYTE